MKGQKFKVGIADYEVWVQASEDWIQFTDEGGGWGLSRKLFDEIVKKLETR